MGLGEVLNNTHGYGQKETTRHSHAG